MKLFLLTGVSKFCHFSPHYLLYASYLFLFREKDISELMEFDTLAQNMALGICENRSRKVTHFPCWCPREITHTKAVFLSLYMGGGGGIERI
jgi:hypothetical protein